MGEFQSFQYVDRQLLLRIWKFGQAAKLKNRGPAVGADNPVALTDGAERGFCIASDFWVEDAQVAKPGLQLNGRRAVERQVQLVSGDGATVFYYLLERGKHGE